MRAVHGLRQHSRKAALLLCGTAAFFAASGAAFAADIPPIVPPPPPPIIIEPEDVPRFYLSLQALYMTRTNPPETPILTPELITAGALQETDVNDGLNANQIDYGWAFGLAGRAGLIGEPVGFDFGGFWLKPMEAIVNVFTEESLGNYILWTDPTLFYITNPEEQAAEAYAATRIYGFDANVTFSPNEDFTLFAGAAFVRVQDELLLDIFPTAGDVVEADWTTNNRLIGPQVGVRGQFGQNALSFGFEFRAAYLFNHAAGTADIDDGVIDITVDDDEKSRTLMLAGGVNVGFNINENVTLTAGYQAMWFKALAMAPAQVPATDPLTPALDLDTTSPLLVHGFALGLTARF
ncbi:MAG: hypothetical protein AB7O56_00130 [Bauldia sp.]